MDLVRIQYKNWIPANTEFFDHQLGHGIAEQVGQITRIPYWNLSIPDNTPRFDRFVSSPSVPLWDWNRIQFVMVKSLVPYQHLNVVNIKRLSADVTTSGQSNVPRPFCGGWRMDDAGKGRLGRSCGWARTGVSFRLRSGDNGGGCATAECKHGWTGWTTLNVGRHSVAAPTTDGATIGARSRRARRRPRTTA